MTDHTQGVKVRHSTFADCTGRAIRETVKTDLLGYEKYSGCVVEWDRPFNLDTIMANYNLVFIVPAKGVRR